MFSDDQKISAVTMTELARGVSAVVGRVVAGERVIVTRHGLPAAVILSIVDGRDVVIAGSEAIALLRREAREQLEAGQTVPLTPWR